MSETIQLVSKEGDIFQITLKQANTSGLLRRIVLDRAVNCRLDLISDKSLKNFPCNCYRCNSKQATNLPSMVNLDRISSSLLQKVCEFMAYKVKTNEIIESTISSTSPNKVRDLCNRIDGFSIGDQSSEILDLLVLADYLDI